MASNEPSQTRAVDPFASYDSSSVNKLTRAITRGNDGLAATPDLDVTTDDTTATILYVSTGIAFKDDVIVELTAQHTVDFHTLSHYLNNTGGTLNETGFYYVVLDYSWRKARPAPTAKIKILRPSERSDYISGSYPSALFLKAAKVENVSGSNIITALYDYDPDNISVEREYVSLRVNTEIDLPTHTPTRDEGRIVYERSVDKFWFGFEDRWEEISAGVSLSINTDSTGVEVGMLCYTDSDNRAQLAISESITTRAEFVVQEVGTVESGNGRAKLAGTVQNVQVASGVIVAAGDVLYLSDTYAGKVTNVRPSGTYQVVGRALSVGSVTTPITMLFFPGDIIFTAVTGSIDTGDWTYDSTSTFYFYDIDITTLNLAANACLCETFVDGFKIYPGDLEIRDAGTTLRVYMPVNTQVVDYIVSDGAGGGSATGGGGGTTSHALLTNLDYATSGHTGFAPSPHGNAHHSETFITASGVTFENLDANGDVGTGASQVSQGTHTHSNIDIPVGTTMLIESDTQITGWTLETDIDDELVYITKGSGAGGDTGGDLKGTWTWPSHTLDITEMPVHDHGITQTKDVVDFPNDEYRVADSYSTSDTVTGPAGGLAGVTQPHSHGGTTFRPRGRNYTRQTKN